MFLFKGNICGKRIRIARAIHKPYLTQDQLDKKYNVKIKNSVWSTRVVEKNKQYAINLFARCRYNLVGFDFV